jgi:hypothetical protein
MKEKSHKTKIIICSEACWYIISYTWDGILHRPPSLCSNDLVCRLCNIWNETDGAHGKKADPPTTAITISKASNHADETFIL